MVSSVASNHSSDEITSLPDEIELGTGPSALPSQPSASSPTRTKGERPHLEKRNVKFRQPSVLTGLMSDVFLQDESKHKKSATKTRAFSLHADNRTPSFDQHLGDIESVAPPKSSTSSEDHGWSFWKEETIDVGAKAIKHQPTEEEREAIETFCQSLSRPRFRFRSFVPGRKDSSEQLRELPVSVPSMTNYLLDSSKIRKQLVEKGGRLDRELLFEVLARAADTSVDEFTKSNHASERILAATKIVEKFGKDQKTGWGFNPESFFNAINQLKELASDRMYFEAPGVTGKYDLSSIKKKIDLTDDELLASFEQKCKAAGVILGVLIAATHRYVDDHDQWRKNLRNLAAFGVCTLWAVSPYHPKMTLAAAIVVPAYALYELLVPNLKDQFDVKKLRFNLQHAAIKETMGVNRAVKEGAELALLANGIS